MKNLLLVFALFVGGISFSQGLTVNNGTLCTKYVQAYWVDGACGSVPSSPAGWIAIPPGGTMNFAAAGPASTELEKVVITNNYPTCLPITLDNIFNPCYSGPINGGSWECSCGGAPYSAEILSVGMNHTINIYY